MVSHDPIFSEFQPVKVEADGASVYDFLGVATQARFKKGWERFAPSAGTIYQPNLPVLNEHYLDWVVVLESVARAHDTYRVVELGAGWGTWASAALAACRQNSRIGSVEAVAVEADLTHWNWMKDHFAQNDFPSDGVHLIHGAVGARSGKVSFPVIDNPDEDYGASTRNQSAAEYVSVRAYTIREVLDLLSGPADFMHVDIQGAEYDVLPTAMGQMNDKVKAALVGTHISSEHHHSMVKLFKDAGWRIRMNYERGQYCETPYGRIQLGDGVVVAENARFV
ncbi:FkbM family methyltransferase [Maricaulis sp.]|uniref:FkbM family methyltransferase n=1 Tax=Maricaulis sp. TaxID=1486257 RepID=UPI0026272BF8|nr:FkbM family methyltransferase [Maricaulis sp.]